PPLLSIYPARFSLLLLVTRPPPTSPLFPYTTLFRSPAGVQPHHGGVVPVLNADQQVGLRLLGDQPGHGLLELAGRYLAGAAAARSEEHTSELQSLTNLVCRLLLEKKKNSPQLHLPQQ